MKGLINLIISGFLLSGCSLYNNLIKKELINKIDRGRIFNAKTYEDYLYNEKLKWDDQSGLVLVVSAYDLNRDGKSDLAAVFLPLDYK